MTANTINVYSIGSEMLQEIYDTVFVHVCGCLLHPGPSLIPVCQHR